MAQDNLLKIEYTPAMQELRDYINDECIFRTPKGSRELVTMEGHVGRWQFYLRACMFRTDLVNTIANEFWRRIIARELDPHSFQLAGVDSAATPLLGALVATAHTHGIQAKAFSIRKDRKTYGKRNIFEGVPDKNLPVMFVDDLTSPTHATFWHAVNHLDQHGFKLYPQGFVIVYKDTAKANRTLHTTLGRITFDSLFTLSDFSMGYAQYEYEKHPPIIDGNTKRDDAT